MWEQTGSAFVTIVPLVAGLLLLATCAIIMFRNPTISNTHAAVLGVGALLCVAPTLATLNLKAPGIELSTAVRQQVGEQGAEIKRDLAYVREQIDVLLKKSGATVPVAAPVDKANGQTTILILYNEARKPLAKNVEEFLLRKGYGANAIYTDFTELPSGARLANGAVSIVYATQQTELANKIKQELLTKFSDLASLTDTVLPKVGAGDVQLRLF